MDRTALAAWGVDHLPKRWRFWLSPTGRDRCSAGVSSAQVPPAPRGARDEKFGIARPQDRIVRDCRCRGERIGVCHRTQS